MEYKEIINNSYYHDNTGMLLKGDCLEVMKDFPDKSIDMILCDLPYGITSSAWDIVIDFKLLWVLYERIIKDNGAIILFSSQPFTTDLINSNRGLFKQELIWYKNTTTGSALAKKRPLKQHENIVIFYKNQPTYNPQMTQRSEKELKRLSKNSKLQSSKKMVTGNFNIKTQKRENMKYKYPTTILEFNAVFNRGPEKTDHPNQKPIGLCEYLIKTYTNENEIVLDNAAGSCTTTIACKNTDRRWICIEQELKYCDISVERIKNYVKTT